MIASIAPLMRRPMMGRGEAAAEPGRDNGRLYCVDASMQMTELEATSGSASSIQYSKVLSKSSCAAWSTTTGWGSEGACGCGGGAGASIRASGSGPSMVNVKDVDGCGRGGAEKEPRRNVLVMSKENTNLKAFK